MNKVCNIICTLLLIACSYGCDSELDEALLRAGDNRGEMEKVLEHFKNDPDGLKYDAARFLIINMPYHYTYTGACMDSLDSAYREMAAAPTQKRVEVFNNLKKNIDDSKAEPIVDITSVSAAYLIKAVDDACYVWNHSGWSKDYDKSIFFDYVLPYRLLNEPLSDWRELIASEYYYLSDTVVWSKRGVYMESENAMYDGADIVSKESASGGKMVMMKGSSAEVSYKIMSPLPSRKFIYFRYTSVDKESAAEIVINGTVVDTLHFELTPSLDIFKDERIGYDARLLQGKNILTLRLLNGSVGLDRIQVANIEPYDENRQTDFSNAVCQIQNKKTRHFIMSDTVYSPTLDLIQLRKESKGNTLFDFTYIGYACWNLFSHDTDSTRRCMEVRYCLTEPNAPISFFQYGGGNHQKWVVLPASGGYYKIMNKDSGLFLESINDSVSGKEILVQNPYSSRDSQKWNIIINRQTVNSDGVNGLFVWGSAISKALKAFDLTNQWEWIAYESTIPPKATSLCKFRTGNCRDEADYLVYICRSLGIPSAVDFTPHWGNRSQSHSWSVLIKPDGSSTPFYMGTAPGDTMHYYHSYKKPKILRHRFQLNRRYANDLRYETELPNLFVAPDYIDVTDEYYTTTDIVRDIPEEYTDHKVAYICVFDNRQWVPVFYGNISKGKVTFKSMGRGIMYIAAFYEDGQIKPFGNPFLLTSSGQVRDIAIMKGKQTMKLLRKYPFMGKEDHFNSRMSGGRFQGANKSDFSDACNFYIFDGLTNGNWYEVEVSDTITDRYRYLRYIGPNGSYCNINELVFYDEKGQQIKGKMIGTEGQPWASVEKVFDGDILTGFDAVSPDGHWVGLQPYSPSRVGKIRFIPRNDGNGVEIGDEYKLYYWHNDGWEEIANMKATRNELVFHKMPKGGLYVLRDMTKGHEERIFTYENGEQVWW